jgi:hypothetical protein
MAIETTTEQEWSVLQVAIENHRRALSNLLHLDIGGDAVTTHNDLQSVAKKLEVFFEGLFAPAPELETEPPTDVVFHINPAKVNPLDEAVFNPYVECDTCHAKFVGNEQWATRWARTHVASNPEHEVLLTRTRVERWAAPAKERV